jgi:hypothetical protein
MQWKCSSFPGGRAIGRTCLGRWPSGTDAPVPASKAACPPCAPRWHAARVRVSRSSLDAFGSTHLEDTGRVASEQRVGSVLHAQQGDARVRTRASADQRPPSSPAAAGLSAPSSSNAWWERWPRARHRASAPARARARLICCSCIAPRRLRARRLSTQLRRMAQAQACWVLIANRPTSPASAG